MKGAGSVRWYAMAALEADGGVINGVHCSSGEGFSSLLTVAAH
jgi:hypothetical protein